MYEIRKPASMKMVAYRPVHRQVLADLRTDVAVLITVAWLSALDSTFTTAAAVALSSAAASPVPGVLAVRGQADQQVGVATDALHLGTVEAVLLELGADLLDVHRLVEAGFDQGAAGEVSA
jgi:hypothetical protein